MLIDLVKRKRYDAAFLFQNLVQSAATVEFIIVLAAIISNGSLRMKESSRKAWSFRQRKRRRSHEIGFINVPPACAFFLVPG